MSYLRRPCAVCGEGINQGENADQMVVGTESGALYICKECLWHNPTFRKMAASYVLEKAEAAMVKEEKK